MENCLSLEMLGRFLFLSEKPFTRWGEIGSAEQRCYLTKARRVLELHKPYDYVIEDLDRILRKANAQRAKKAAGIE